MYAIGLFCLHMCGDKTLGKLCATTPCFSFQVLTENLLQSLIQYIPAPDQLNRLKEHEEDYENLAEAEQFAISISGIKRLVPRLKSLMFRQR